MGASGVSPSRLSAGSGPDLRPTVDSSTIGTTARRGWVAGVDEAGLGPILGPLVVAGIALDGPAGRDPWDLLGSVSRDGRARDRIRVSDSKKIKQGPRGLERLERTVLTFATAIHGRLPADVAELLTLSGVDLAPFARCPWYVDLARPLPRWNDAATILAAATTLTADLTTARITFEPPRLRALDAEEFNQRIAATDNKSETHFEAFGGVLAALLAAGPDRAEVICDRCGGRSRYRDRLRALVDGATVRVLAESAELSRYAIRSGGRRIEVTFAADAEERAFPTALASCFAKYVRELAMECMNLWFAARIDELRPTAGYYTDGLRFLGDVEALLARDRLPRHRLVRIR